MGRSGSRGGYRERSRSRSRRRSDSRGHSSRPAKDDGRRDGAPRCDDRLERRERQDSRDRRSQSRGRKPPREASARQDTARRRDDSREPEFIEWRRSPSRAKRSPSRRHVQRSPSKRPAQRSPSRRRVQRSPSRRPVQRSPSRRPVQRSPSRRPVQRSPSRRPARGGRSPSKSSARRPHRSASRRQPRETSRAAGSPSRSRSRRIEADSRRDVAPRRDRSERRERRDSRERSPLSRGRRPPPREASPRKDPVRRRSDSRKPAPKTDWNEWRRSPDRGGRSLSRRPSRCGRSPSRRGARSPSRRRGRSPSIVRRRKPSRSAARNARSPSRCPPKENAARESRSFSRSLSRVLDEAAAAAKRERMRRDDQMPEQMQQPHQQQTGQMDEEQERHARMLEDMLKQHLTHEQTQLEEKTRQELNQQREAQRKDDEQRRQQKMIEDMLKQHKEQQELKAKQEEEQAQKQQQLLEQQRREQRQKQLEDEYQKQMQGQGQQLQKSEQPRQMEDKLLEMQMQGQGQQLQKSEQPRQMEDKLLEMLEVQCKQQMVVWQASCTKQMEDQLQKVPMGRHSQMQQQLKQEMQKQMEAYGAKIRQHTETQMQQFRQMPAAMQAQMLRHMQQQESQKKQEESQKTEEVDQKKQESQRVQGQEEVFDPQSIAVGKAISPAFCKSGGVKAPPSSTSGTGAALPMPPGAEAKASSFSSSQQPVGAGRETAEAGPPVAPLAAGMPPNAMNAAALLGANPMAAMLMAQNQPAASGLMQNGIPVAAMAKSNGGAPTLESPLCPPPGLPPTDLPGSALQESRTYTCPDGHTLSDFRTNRSGFSCSLCKNEFPSNTLLWGCRKCDFDKCEDCCRKEEKRIRPLPKDQRIRQIQSGAMDAREATLASAATKAKAPPPDAQFAKAPQGKAAPAGPPPKNYTGMFSHPDFGDKDIAITLSLTSPTEGHWCAENQTEQITVMRQGDHVLLAEKSGVTKLVGQEMPNGAIVGVVVQEDKHGGRFHLNPLLLPALNTAPAPIPEGIKKLLRADRIAGGLPAADDDDEEWRERRKWKGKDDDEDDWKDEEWDDSWSGWSSWHQKDGERENEEEKREVQDDEMEVEAETEEGKNWWTAEGMARKGLSKGRRGKGKGKGKKGRDYSRTREKKYMPDDMEPPDMFDDEHWEEPREKSGLCLLGELAPEGSKWDYIVKDESRRSFAAFMPCPFEKSQTATFFDTIKNGTDWKRPESKRGLVPRKTAWMVKEGCSCHYKYGGTEVEPQEFPPWMKQLLGQVMPKCGASDPKDWPDSCNLNLYEDGQMSVGWHADDERLFQGKFRDIAIVSISFGQTRKFQLRLNFPQDDERNLWSCQLGDGDLMTMEGMLQKHYMHRVPKEEGLEDCPRINLTWRWILRHDTHCPQGRSRPNVGDRDKDRGVGKGKGKGRKELCGDFRRGTCDRGQNCRFSHGEDEKEDLEETIWKYFGDLPGFETLKVTAAGTTAFVKFSDHEKAKEARSKGRDDGWKVDMARRELDDEGKQAKEISTLACKMEARSQNRDGPRRNDSRREGGSDWRRNEGRRHDEEDNNRSDQKDRYRRGSYGDQDDSRREDARFPPEEGKDKDGTTWRKGEGENAEGQNKWSNDPQPQQESDSSWKRSRDSSPPSLNKSGEANKTEESNRPWKRSRDSSPSPKALIRPGIRPVSSALENGERGTTAGESAPHRKGEEKIVGTGKIVPPQWKQDLKANQDRQQSSEGWQGSNGRHDWYKNGNRDW